MNHAARLLIGLFICSQSFAATQTVFGPKTYSPIGRPVDITENFTAAAGSGYLDIVNGDGKDISLEKCSGSFVKVILCETKNMLTKLEVEFTRPSKIIIDLNGQNISTSALTPYKGSIRVNTSFLAKNKMRVRVDGFPLSKVKLTATGTTGSINLPPVANFTLTPTSGIAPETVSFNAALSSDPDGTMNGYAWDFGDGTFGQGALVSHIYQAKGTYQIKLTVTDNQGAKATKSANLVLGENALPIPAFTYTSKANLGDLKVSFDASTSTDTDGSIVEYNWNFGDGSTQQGKTVDHLYSSNGTYQVTLTIKDNKFGIATITKDINLEDKAPPILLTLSPADGAVINGTEVTVAATSNEALSSAQILVEGENSVQASLGSDRKSFSAAVSSQSAGIKKITISVKDLAGNESIYERSVRFAFKLPPIADFKFLSKTSGIGPLMVYMDASKSTDPQGLSLVYVWKFSDGSEVVSLSPTTTHEFAQVGRQTVTLTVINSDNLEASKSAEVEVLEAPTLPNPSTIASEIPENTVVSLHDQLAFLYQGQDAPQKDVIVEKIDADRASMISGKVLSAGEGLGGVKVSVLGHPEFGYTLTRENGEYQLVANAGSKITLNFFRSGYTSSQRFIETNESNYYQVETLSLLRFDSKATSIAMGASTGKVAEGSPVEDQSGKRTAAAYFPPGLSASVVMKDGTTVPLDSITFRATEYTVGDNGAKQMPAQLPRRTGYTYAADFSADESLALGGTGIKFNKPVAFYVDNFLNIPTGYSVPVGWYNDQKGEWQAELDGVVIKVLSITDQKAQITFKANEAAATATELNALGITDDELSRIASTYEAGKSFWRAQANHLSSFDLNFLNASMPPDGEDTQGAPNHDEDKLAQIEGEENSECGCIIDVSEGRLRDTIDLWGTGRTLYYSSDRLVNRKTTDRIWGYVTGYKIEPVLKKVDVTISIAGRTFEKSYTSLVPWMTYDFSWDGKDAFGRILTTPTELTVKLKYYLDNTYQVELFSPGSSSFTKGSSTINLVNVRDRGEYYVEANHKTKMAPLMNSFAFTKKTSIGGWTFDIHHSLDPANRNLYFGNGTHRYQRTEEQKYVQTIVGNKSPGFSGDGGPANQAQVRSPGFVTTGPDGSIYIADSGNNRIRKINKNKIITTIAGNGNAGFSGDGSPATDAELNNPTGIFVAADGTIYFADTGNNAIRKIAVDGTISTLAGTGNAGYSGDNGPAASATFNSPRHVLLAQDGTIYVADTKNHVIRRILHNGKIYTIAGNGASADGTVGGNARDTSFIAPIQLIEDSFEQIHVVDEQSNNVRYIDTAGKMVLTYSWTSPISGLVIINPGNNLILDNNSIVITDPNQTPFIITGGNITARDRGDTTADRPGHSAKLTNPKILHLAKDWNVYFVESSTHRVRAMRQSMNNTVDRNFTIPSEDGSEVFIFDENGRHLKTLYGKTGSLKYQFEYENNALSKIVLDNQRFFSIVRDVDGRPTQIVGPYGQIMDISADGNGYLKSLRQPTGETFSVVHDSNGYLSETSRPSGATSKYYYTDTGTLAKVVEPNGAEKTLTQNGNAVAYTSPMGRGYTVQKNTGYAYGFRSYYWKTDLDGLLTSGGTWFNAKRKYFPDGSSISEDIRPSNDQNGITKSVFDLKIRKANGETLSRWEDEFHDEIVAPFQVRTQRVVYHEDNPVYEDDNSILRTKTSVTSTNSLKTFLKYDEKERTILSQQGNLAPIEYSYNNDGNISEIKQGDRVTLYTYDSFGNLSQVRDALGRITSFSKNASGQLLAQTLPNGRTIEFQYDINGNNQGIKPADKSFHLFDFNIMDLISVYRPPSVSGQSFLTSFTYDLEKSLTSESAPDGQIINYERHPTSGRLLRKGNDTYFIETKWDTNGRIVGYDTSDGIGLRFIENEEYLNAKIFSGIFDVTVKTYKNFDRRISETIGNGPNFQFGTNEMDKINQLWKDGTQELSLSYDQPSGLHTGITASLVQANQNYSSYGELAAQNVSANGSSIYSVTYSRDKLGRIESKTEVVLGQTSTWSYTYDLAGRLISATKNGQINTYTYDDNGNRIGGSVRGQTTSAQYDEQDRLTAYNGQHFSYSPKGDLSSQINSFTGETTTYQHDIFGGLRMFAKSNQPAITYKYDGETHKVAKLVDGIFKKGFIYNAFGELVGELGENKQIVAHYLYLTGSHSPDYMIKNGIPYILVKDNLGSIRLVVDRESGSVAQRISYDEFGVVLEDTNPGFQVFGYAGGIYDPETQLVKFGARDYNPNIGRWITKDPAKFDGGDTNLYGYVANDPINYIDTTGKWAVFIIRSYVYGIVLYNSINGAINKTVTACEKKYAEYKQQQDLQKQEEEKNKAVNDFLKKEGLPNVKK